MLCCKVALGRIRGASSEAPGHERRGQFLAGLGHAVLLGDHGLDVGDPFGKGSLKVERRKIHWEGLHLSRVYLGLPDSAARCVLERTFAWLCRNRRLAKDFETRVDNAAAYLQIAMIKLLTRRLARA